MNPVPAPDAYRMMKSPALLQHYREFFTPFQSRDVRLLELGVLHGGSLLYWRDLFPNGKIVGLDVDKCAVDDSSGRVVVYQGRQQDPALLDRVRAESAPDGFDIIIDDASHIGQHVRMSFWRLFDHHLKPGGLYVIEDWGTGYYDSWADGKHYDGVLATPGYSGVPSPLWERVAERLPDTGWLAALRKRLPPARAPSHSYGVVGFVKELIDECNMFFASDPYGGGKMKQRPSKIDRMIVLHQHIFVFKTTPDINRLRCGDVADPS